MRRVDQVQRSAAGRWTVGTSDDPQASGTVLTVGPFPQDYAPLGGALVLVDQCEVAGVLPPAVAAGCRQELQHLLSQEASDYAGGGGATDGSAVAQAVTRRLSRESVHMADAIDRVATTVAEHLGAPPGLDEVRLDGVDHLDRTSLKVLTRAFQYVARTAPSLRWEWHFQSDVLHAPATTQLRRARQGIFARIATVLSPRVEVHKPQPFVPPVGSAPTSALATARNVVLQNYDACLLRDVDDDDPDQLRLRGIALVNIGDLHGGLDCLTLSAARSTHPTRRAMAHYLRSLVFQKRLHDPHAARRALDEADRALDGCDDTAEVRLERAWRLNGLALGEALRWRGSDGQVTEAAAAAGELLSEAFWLVQTDDAPAAVYLRHNLLANAAFLREMTGDVDGALQVFREVFLSTVPDPALMPPGTTATTLCYRLGMLESRRGAQGEADRLLEAAARSARATGSRWSLEIVLRALAYVRAVNGDRAGSEAASDEGYRVARDIGSDQGLQHHLRALLSAQHPGAMTRPATKLPAFFPEFDLEDSPATSLNLLLAG